MRLRTLDPSSCKGVYLCQLAWIADWYVRDETCRQGLASIINAQHRHPFAAHWGDGTTSSSDAQQFPVGGRSASIGQVNAHYGTEPGVKLYPALETLIGDRVTCSSTRKVRKRADPGTSGKWSRFRRDARGDRDIPR
jgi:TnpA family transposase